MCLSFREKQYGSKLKPSYKSLVLVLPTVYRNVLPYFINTNPINKNHILSKFWFKFSTYILKKKKPYIEGINIGSTITL